MAFFMNRFLLEEVMKRQCQGRDEAIDLGTPGPAALAYFENTL
jgi:hypothetical protein